MARTVISLSSLQDTRDFAKNLTKNLQPGDIYAFFGDVGAGKTTLIKNMLSFLNYPEAEVTSPTFTLLNIYPTTPIIYHFDLYRFQTENDFLKKGFDEYFDLDGVCLIEWAEKIPHLLPKRAKKIHLTHHEGKRSCFKE